MPELTPDAEQLLLRYQWPGNIRELKNMTERLVVRASEAPIRPDDLPREARGEARADRARDGGARRRATDPRAQTAAGRHVVRGTEKPPSGCGSG